MQKCRKKGNMVEESIFGRRPGPGKEPVMEKNEKKEKKYLESYKAAGVDIAAGQKAVKLIKASAERTIVGPELNSRVLGAFEATNGLFDLTGLGSAPVMVTSTDAVGSKLKIAAMMDRHNTVGIDCVAMCVNDLLCCGARPLVFTNYLSMSKLVPQQAEAIIAGVAEGCIQSGCALVGGKAAEMPDFYAAGQIGQYDLAGVAVGVVERSRRINGSGVRKGDVILGLASSGIHANGYALVRKVFDIENKGLDRFETVLGRPLGEVLMDPSRIYAKAVLALLEEVDVKSLCHVTKGGLYINVPRSLPEGLTARINVASLKTQPIFHLLQRVGNIPRKDMFATFNMGVGMTVTVAPEDVEDAMRILRTAGEKVMVIGEVVPGEEMILD